MNEISKISMFNISFVTYPLLLAIGSSIDNFTVGLTLGIKNSSRSHKYSRRRRSLNRRFNLCISIANAIGAGLAGSLGHVLLDNMISGENAIASLMPFSTPGNQCASLLAGIAFYYLSIAEFIADRHSNKDDEICDITCGSMKDAIQLAVPMTLNNLAGGVAGGAAGISAGMSFALALVCSYAMMDCGYMVGRNFRSQWIEEHANVIAGAIFGILGNIQIVEHITR